MMKNGRPYSNENGWCDDSLITDRPKEEMEAICNWIKTNIEGRKTANYKHSSYKLKHYVEKDLNLYLTNNEFKDAMLLCGYEPVDENELNWHYRISELSLALQKRKPKPMKRIRI